MYWLIYFEDKDHAVEIFTDEVSAKKRFAEAQLAWACHLFMRIPDVLSKGEPIAIQIRNALNSHYWRDGKGCSCDFWVGDYNMWMAAHMVPLLTAICVDWAKEYYEPELAGLEQELFHVEGAVEGRIRKGILEEVSRHPQHHIFSVHSGAIVQSSCECGEQFPTQGSCEAWQKHILDLKERTR